MRGKRQRGMEEIASDNSQRPRANDCANQSRAYVFIMIATKSIIEPIEKKRDGLRILASRFRGHGVSKSQYDVWMANLGPSDPLLRKFLDGVISWLQFRTQYRQEMLHGLGYEEPNRKLRNSGQKFTLRLLNRLAEKQTITVLCHCAKEEAHCHRHVLKELIDRVK
jgi:uncharacterized protein YeaO (DUF488 family)